MAAVAVLFAWLQWRVSRQEKVAAEQALLHELADEWRRMRVDWNRSMMLARGAGEYYVELPWAEQEQYLALRHAGAGARHFIPNIWLGSEESIPVSAGLIKAYKAMSEHDRQMALSVYTTSARDTIFFLVRVSNALVRGHLSVAAAYGAFGASILNNTTPIRRLLGDDYFYYMLRGHPDRALAFVDLMHAQGVRSGDVAQGDVAKHKRRTRSGLFSRRRIRLLARLEGGDAVLTSGIWQGFRLEYLLTWSETRRRSFRQRLRVFIGGKPWMKIGFSDHVSWSFNFDRAGRGPSVGLSRYDVLSDAPPVSMSTTLSSYYCAWKRYLFK